MGKPGQFDESAGLALLAKSGLKLTKADLVRLRDPLFRLSCGLYQISTKSAGVIPFRPRLRQLELLKAVYRDRYRRWLIVKARQFGFSTLIELMALDAAYFGENIQCSIVDQNQADASKKLREKCKFAYERMPGELKTRLVSDSAARLEFDNGSAISAGMHARGGTNHFLHGSELGPIAFNDPERAEEMRTGALPSVPDDGMCFIESTFMGGKGGLFYEMITRAQETPDPLKTVKDFRLLFSPWMDNPEYSLDGDMSRVTAATHKYLNEIEALTGVKLTPGQRLWYQVTAEEQGIFMFREYPSVIEECWSSPVKGAIYADLISRIRAAGQIYAFPAASPWNRAYPVFTSWDLGWSDTTDIWWFQLVGMGIFFIRHVTLKHHSAAMAATVVRDAGIPVACHFLPHDACNTTANTGTSYRTELMKAGLQNIRPVPRTPDVWIGIGQVRDALPRCTFNLADCKHGLDGLEAYRKKDDNNGAAIIPVPVHDWASHIADALRTGIEAMNAGLVSDISAIAQQQQRRRMPDRALSAPGGIF
ncbi:hypothetical protein OpiT1DRAFT_05429 [Opitutaceae bacterium TAV1]|nr:hypothetical protein OpiT1DRAFT_05429 [Opitutaceae bacterium TAV1]